MARAADYEILVVEVAADWKLAHLVVAGSLVAMPSTAPHPAMHLDGDGRQHGGGYCSLDHVRRKVDVPRAHHVDDARRENACSVGIELVRAVVSVASE